MPDTSESLTTATPPAELRVTITVPLPADPFRQARMLADIQPAIDAATASVTAVTSAAQVESRLVRPKPFAPRKPGAAKEGA